MESISLIFSNCISAIAQQHPINHSCVLVNNFGANSNFSRVELFGNYLFYSRKHHCKCLREMRLKSSKRYFNN